METHKKIGDILHLIDQVHDKLFKVNINHKTGYICFLFEHKSYKDNLVLFQILRYMIEIWESTIKKQGTNELPIIIPLVIYHGKDEWNFKTKLSEMINDFSQIPEEIKSYIPNYEYLIYDLTKYNDSDIKLESITRIIVKIANPISGEGSELVMTIAEKLRQEGRQEGKQEGKQEVISKVVKNAIIKGMSIKDIMDLTGLTEKEIDKLRKEMLQR